MFAPIIGGKLSLRPMDWVRCKIARYATNALVTS